MLGYLITQAVRAFLVLERGRERLRNPKRFPLHLFRGFMIASRPSYVHQDIGRLLFFAEAGLAWLAGDNQ